MSGLLAVAWVSDSVTLKAAVLYSSAVMVAMSWDSDAWISSKVIHTTKRGEDMR